MTKLFCFKSATMVAVVALLLSCEHKSDKVLPQKIAFEHNIMKPWFDTYCATCHSSGRSNYLNWHYNPEDFESSFSLTYRTKIYDRVYVKKEMPKGAALSAQELEKFKTWADAGYAAK